MPKEIVRGAHDGKTVGDGGLIETTFTKIGWTKGHCHVEIGVLKPKDGMRFLAYGEASPDETDGWFMQLDREGCNRLIRVVRQARDQAFGRDE